MEWNLNWGTKDHEGLFKNMRRDGLIHPADLTRPALKDSDKRYYNAYRSLSASRMWSQVGPNPIQVSEVAAYLGMLGIEDPDTRLKYLKIVQGLDIVERNIIAKRKK